MNITNDERSFYYNNWKNLTAKEATDLSPKYLNIDFYPSISKFIEWCRHNNIDYNDSSRGLSFTSIRFGLLLKDNIDVWYITNTHTNVSDLCIGRNQLLYQLFLEAVIDDACVNKMKEKWPYNNADIRKDLLEKAYKMLDQYDEYTLEKFVESGFDMD